MAFRVTFVVSSIHQLSENLLNLMKFISTIITLSSVTTGLNQFTASFESNINSLIH